MKLANPVTIQPPKVVLPNGEEKEPPAITISELRVVVIDDNKTRICQARLWPCRLPVVLWKGDDYDAAGDYTQAQVEARVLELLGDDPKAVLENLFLLPKPNHN